jgi:hypothetical protein
VPPDPARSRPLDRPLSSEEAVAYALDEWRETLVRLVGGSSLENIDVLGDAVIDLSAAHPSGLAQLLAGRPTRLSNLFREPDALPAARRRARAVVARTLDYAQRYGMAPTYLAIGVATWTARPGSAPSTDDLGALARVATTPVRRLLIDPPPPQSLSEDEEVTDRTGRSAEPDGRGGELAEGAKDVKGSAPRRARRRTRPQPRTRPRTEPSRRAPSMLRSSCAR